MNTSTMAYQSQANTSNAKPVTDTLTISGVDAYQTTLTGVKFGSSGGCVGVDCWSGLRVIGVRGVGG